MKQTQGSLHLQISCLAWKCHENESQPKPGHCAMWLHRYIIFFWRTYEKLENWKSQMAMFITLLYWAVLPPSFCRPTLELSLTKTMGPSLHTQKSPPQKSHTESHRPPPTLKTEKHLLSSKKVTPNHIRIWLECSWKRSLLKQALGVTASWGFYSLLPTKTNTSAVTKVKTMCTHDLQQAWFPRDDECLKLCMKEI